MYFAFLLTIFKYQDIYIIMEIIFFILIISSVAIMLFTNPAGIISVMQNGCTKAIDLSINLISIYALWLGLLELIDKSTLSQKIAKLVKPITRLLFKNIDQETENLLALNIASNILGMGNASTPSGIMAMEKFDNGSGKINRNMIILVLLNSCAIQVLPSTIIGVRIQYGSVSPSDIILPNILASFLTTFIGISIALFIEKIKERRIKNE